MKKENHYFWQLVAILFGFFMAGFAVGAFLVWVF